MKFFNLLETISSDQEKYAQRWFLFSLTAIVITIGILLFVQIKQIRAYHSLCVSCACCAKIDEDHAQLTKRIEELQQKEKELQEKLSEFSKLNQIAQQMITRFKCLAKLCAADSHLQSYSANDHELQMTITAPSSEKISQLLASMMASKAFDNLILVSMQPKDNGYLFTIKNRC